MIVLDRSDEVRDWVRERTNVVFGDCAAVGVEIDGQLVAGVVYYNNRGNDMELAIASDNPQWITRQKIKFLLGLPFKTFGVRRITCLIEKGNKRSRKLCEGLGFVLEGKARKAINEHDAMIYGLLREEYEEWLKKTAQVCPARSNTSP